ncbi:c06d6995-d411-4e3f-b632-36f3bb893c6d [Sclerotinia trifoliorum]|uniref:C06d6995-d411-4e3f-b632-36f3bb893c6d n=1 Tax=Sclerotinia trifoliorum TaxID=28548 RepID=A0A8H2VYF3_9HELO|nr:c06d6995-d411-4e3f-b632-36f3bb893c6d [Sclerotinia trifoliorum]
MRCLYGYGRSVGILPTLTRATTKKWPVQRTRHLATAIPLQVERYDITCGISGEITVEVHNASLLHDSPTTPLVVYLPPYPSSPPLRPPSWLLNSYPVFNIPYRWSHKPSISFRNQKSHPFPIPLHDTLHAYSWLLNRYLPHLLLGGRTLDSTFLSDQPPAIQRPLLIYGSYLGGTLATSLALTESRNSPLPPAKIDSLIVHNGIFDWTPISTTPDPSIFPSEFSDFSSSNPSYDHPSTLELYTHSPWTIKTLHALKTRLFPSPSQTFDPFASPILFFRTPGIQVPQRWPIPPPISYSPPNKHTSPKPGTNTQPFSKTQNPRYKNPTSYPPSEDEEESRHESLDESRKSKLIFPPLDSSIKIPRSLFTYSSLTTPVSTTQTQTQIQTRTKKEKTKEKEKEKKETNQNIFKQQAQELSELMRRSPWMFEMFGSGKKIKDVEIKEGGWEGEKEREMLVRDWIEEGGL